jgi:spore maturation protein CgeB
VSGALGARRISMRVLYSFNKTGAEAQFWTREIAAASTEEFTFIPFNHEPFLDPMKYIRAQRLDDLYYDQHPGLMSLYAQIQQTLERERIDALFVDNCPPYHPDWLRQLKVLKVLRTSDGPLAAYDRDFAYVHAYDLVLYHSPAYSADMGMAEKLAYVGARRKAFLPLGVFEATYAAQQTEEQLFAHSRDVELIFVGALHVGKMPLLAQVKKAFGSRCRMHGLTTLKRNVYFNVKYGWPGWVRPIDQSQYVPLYQRSKIGFNVHNRGKYTLGSYRLFELAANGVMQISDGDEYLNDFFKVNHEVVGYGDADELVAKIDHYLTHDDERIAIARNAYRRVWKDYRIKQLLAQAGALIQSALSEVKGSGFRATLP